MMRYGLQVKHKFFKKGIPIAGSGAKIVSGARFEQRTKILKK
jgi:hypothetical protein